MVKIRIIIFVLIFSLFNSCSKDEYKNLNVSDIQSQNERLSLNFKSKESPFEVSQSLLYKYVRLFKKGVRVKLIEPITESEELLAYYVEYSDNKGWDIIAADTRLTPVLVSSPEGPTTRDCQSSLTPVRQSLFH